ncbi:MAG: copper chaperone PCu(A)C [Chloroflexota bacterium]
MAKKGMIWILLGLLALAGLAACSPKTSGPNIEIEGAWARPSPKMAGAGAAYMILKNSGSEADKLVSASTTASKVVELHESFMDENNVMKMRPVEGGAIEVPAGGSVELKPGGLHIMLIDLIEPLQSGQTVPLTLEFEKSGEIDIEVNVSEQKPND